MIASLPMYDWPEIRAATDDLWRGIARHCAAHGLAAPENLTRGADHKAAWREAGLFLSQTCGYPFTHEFKGRLALIGTPIYKAEGCAGPLYSSAIFTRCENPRVAAMNDDDSMSGMLALRLAAGDFAQTRITGGHIRSLEALQKGEADICAIDAVCVALARRHRPELFAGLRQVARSPLVPGLPFVTGLARAPELPALRMAVGAAFADPALRACREALLLDGFALTSPSDYTVILELEGTLS